MCRFCNSEKSPQTPSSRWSVTAVLPGNTSARRVSLMQGKKPAAVAVAVCCSGLFPDRTVMLTFNGILEGLKLIFYFSLLKCIYYSEKQLLNFLKRTFLKVWSYFIFYFLLLKYINYQEQQLLSFFKKSNEETFNIYYLRGITMGNESGCSARGKILMLTLRLYYY